MSLKLSWLKFTKAKKKNQESLIGSKKIFLEACHLLRNRREGYGMTRIQLAEKTRITPAVLEAIENGWELQLPEEAYLCKMLKILENELNLPSNSLAGVLEGTNKGSKEQLLKNTSPESIDIFKSWQGSIIYILLMLASIFGLNHHQRNLAKLNSQTFNPIVPDLKILNIRQEAILNNNKFNSPIKGNESKPIIKQIWSNYLKGFFQRNKNFSWLELNLSQDSQLSIKNGEGLFSKIDKLQGSLKLKLIPPIMIEINPLPTINDKVKWQGKTYLPQDRKNGIYIFNHELNKPDLLSKERPEKAPNSP